MRYTALLDANVLVPYTLTDVLLRLAEAGLYRPLWSPSILAETEHTLVHLHPAIAAAALHDRVAAMDQFFPDATVTGWDEIVGSLTLPDPDDRHVLAAAIVGGADAIVTANLRDFPAQTLARFNIFATHPDDFLLDQFDLEPRLAEQVLLDIVEARRNPTVTRGDILDQLHRAGTPRFAAHAR